LYNIDLLTIHFKNVKIPSLTVKKDKKPDNH